MTVKEHYDSHLGNFYAWMTGDFDKNVANFRRFITEQGLSGGEGKKALDLGSGHGIQSVALADLGYQVKAVDFNRQLLDELEIHRQGFPIRTVQSDIVEYMTRESTLSHLIVCWGDTLTHLPSKEVIVQFLTVCSSSLAENGHLVLSFRDYSTELTGDQRFIPVKSTDSRILTCILEYEEERVRVTDLLNERSGDTWQQKVSHYYKTRICPEEVLRVLEKNGLHIVCNHFQQGVITIIAGK